MPATHHLPKSRSLDFLAVGLSGLCLAHCLLLPVAFAALPFLGVLSENHLVHQVLVLMAVPVSLFALMRSGGWRRPGLIGLALAGLGLLGAAAFYEPFEPHETLLSVVGASLLAAMHLTNMRRPHRH